MALKVLLADDDNIAVFLQKIIILESRLADDLVTFTNGQEMIDFLDKEENPEDFYLIFLDINMPVMGGIEFLEVIGAKPYANRVLVALVSSYSMIKDHEIATKYPQVITVYEKPVTTETCNILLNLPLIRSLVSGSTFEGN
ncbi:MAG: response regulator [Ferruginibacter sp.]|nr:response regulator [Ferruginibacter sp.]